MAGKTMTQKEKDDLKKLDHVIANHSGTHPFNIGKIVKKYRQNDLSKDASKGDRPDWLAKYIFVLWHETGEPVPYAFYEKDGNIRSIDAGCLGQLLKQKPPLIEIADADAEDYIVAVRPSQALKNRYNGIGLDKLRKKLGIENEKAADRPLTEPDDAAVSNASLVDSIELTLTFDIAAPVDERRKEESKRTIREGATVFRDSLLRAWNGKCAVTGTAVIPVLEGAHIYRYLGPKTNHLTNGLLLRADVHRLFDRHLLSLRYEGERLLVGWSSHLANSEYAKYQSVSVPQAFHPNLELIAHRYERFLEKEKERRERGDRIG